MGGSRSVERTRRRRLWRSKFDCLKRAMRLGARGLRRVGGRSHAPASSIFLMISQLYTLLAHLRSLGRDGTSCSTSSYLTAVAGRRRGLSGNRCFTIRHFFWGSGGGRRRVIAPPGGRDRAIEQKGRRESVDREWICRLARRRRIDGGTASIAAPPKPATLWRRKVGPEPTGRTLGRKNCPAGHLPATSRQHIATSWREVFGTLTLLSTRSCGGLEAMDRQFGGFRGVRGRRGHKPGIARAASAIERVVGRAGILKKSSPCTAPRGPRWWGRTRSQRTPRVSTR